MKYVVDEMNASFVGEQMQFDELTKAVELARRLSLHETENWGCVTGFYDEKPSHIFIGGVCYRPQKLELVK